MIADLYDRLISGETVEAVNPDNDMEFSIEPARSELLNGAIIGYSIVVDGVVAPGHKGTLMDRETINAWAADLEECNVDDEDWEEELNQIYSSSRGV